MASKFIKKRIPKFEGGGSNKVRPNVAEDTFSQHDGAFDFAAARAALSDPDNGLTKANRRSMLRRLDKAEASFGGERVTVKKEGAGLKWGWVDTEGKDVRKSGVVDSERTGGLGGGKGILGLQGEGYDRLYDYMVRNNHVQFDEVDAPKEADPPPEEKKSEVDQATIDAEKAAEDAKIAAEKAKKEKDAKSSKYTGTEYQEALTSGKVSEDGTVVTHESGRKYKVLDADVMALDRRLNEYKPTAEQLEQEKKDLAERKAAEKVAEEEAAAIEAKKIVSDIDETNYQAFFSRLLGNQDKFDLDKGLINDTKDKRYVIKDDKLVVQTSKNSYRDSTPAESVEFLTLLKQRGATSLSDQYKAVVNPEYTTVWGNSPSLPKFKNPKAADNYSRSLGGLSNVFGAENFLVADNYYSAADYANDVYNRRQDRVGQQYPTLNSFEHKFPSPTAVSEAPQEKVVTSFGSEEKDQQWREGTKPLEGVTDEQAVTKPVDLEWKAAVANMADSSFVKPAPLDNLFTGTVPMDSSKNLVRKVSLDSLDTKPVITPLAPVNTAKTPVIYNYSQEEIDNMSEEQFANTFPLSKEEQDEQFFNQNFQDSSLIKMSENYPILPKGYSKQQNNAYFLGGIMPLLKTAGKALLKKAPELLAKGAVAAGENIGKKEGGGFDAMGAFKSFENHGGLSTMAGALKAADAQPEATQSISIEEAGPVGAASAGENPIDVMNNKLGAQGIPGNNGEITIDGKVYVLKQRRGGVIPKMYHGGTHDKNPYMESGVAKPSYTEWTDLPYNRNLISKPKYDAQGNLILDDVAEFADSEEGSGYDINKYDPYFNPVDYTNKKTITGVDANKLVTKPGTAGSLSSHTNTSTHIANAEEKVKADYAASANNTVMPETTEPKPTDTEEEAGFLEKTLSKVGINPLINYAFDEPITTDVPKKGLIRREELGITPVEGVSEDFKRQGEAKLAEGLSSSKGISADPKVAIKMAMNKDKAVTTYRSNLDSEDISARKKSEAQFMADTNRNITKRNQLRQDNEDIRHTNDVNEAEAEHQAKLLKRQRNANLAKGLVNHATGKAAGAMEFDINELEKNYNGQVASQQQDINRLHQAWIDAPEGAAKDAAYIEFTKSKDKLTELADAYAVEQKKLHGRHSNRNTVWGMLEKSTGVEKKASGGSVAKEQVKGEYKLRQEMMKQAAKTKQQEAKSKANAKLLNKKLDLQREKMLFKNNSIFFNKLRKK